MKKTYSIEGMSCNGCRGHVEKSLLKVSGVSDVSVDLEDAKATIESQFEVPLENLQEALQNSQYSIKPQKVG